MRLTISSMVQKLRRHRPASAEEFKKLLGVELVQAGAGCSREAFAIKGTRLIVKFPMSQEDRGALFHSRKELRRVQQIRTAKRYRALRRYIPKFYYADRDTGIVVMELLNRVGKVPPSVSEVLNRFIVDTFQPRYGADICYDNLGFNGRGQIKILDWGCA